MKGRDTMKTVLFVCVHNAGRSQMAEAFVNKFAAEHHYPIRGLSAGTEAGERVNPLATQAMAELGISLEEQTPKQLTQEMADAADRIITMGCGVDATSCPARIHLSEDWGLDDPAGQSIEKVREIRDQIGRKVDEMIAEIVLTKERADR
jgi:arsenate reductase (thioredoxin)